MKLSRLKNSIVKQVEDSQRIAVPTENELKELLWQPFPGPQTEAFYHPADEMFYGGQAGGGKSGLLLILASMAHTRSIIFRRTYPRLKGLIEKSRKLLSKIARYNSNDKMWRNIPGGRTLEFGSVEYADDVEAYRGNDHDLKAFDEITEFSEDMYRFLIAWNRSEVEGQRSRVVCTGNPPTTPEGRWIIYYWGPWLDKNHPNPAKPGEIRWFASLPDPDRPGKRKDVEVPNGEPFEHEYEGEVETIKPRSRTFIRASLSDNPVLEKSGYRSVLQGLPEPLRSLLLKGVFDADIDDDHPWQVIPSAWVRAAQKRWSDRIFQKIEALGVDVARGGADETILAPKYHNWVGKLIAYPGEQTPNGDKVADLIEENSVNIAKNFSIRIDVVGIGASPYDSLVRRKVHNVHPINGGSVSTKTDRTGCLGFVNKRAEIWWNLRELLDPIHGIGLELPPDDRLFTDLITPRWKGVAIKDAESQVKGLIQVEGKEEIKKRLNGRSPDRGDALAYAYAETESENSADWLGLL